MVDREKVIRQWEGIIDQIKQGNLRRHITINLIYDTFDLLKEQEPVVFCKDCKYWNAGTCLNDRVAGQIQHCGCYPDFATDSDWFCADGERR